MKRTIRPEIALADIPSVLSSLDRSYDLGLGPSRPRFLWIMSPKHAAQAWR
jgi:hypothetical protein